MIHRLLRAFVALVLLAALCAIATIAATQVPAAASVTAHVVNTWYNYDEGSDGVIAVTTGSFTAGDTAIIQAVYNCADTAPSVSDSGSHQWTYPMIGTAWGASNAESAVTQTFDSESSGTHTFTVDPSCTFTVASLFVTEVTDAGIVDVTATKTGTTGTSIAKSTTTQHPDDVFVVQGASDSGIASVGWNLERNVEEAALMTKEKTSAGTYSPTMTANSSNNYVMQVVTIEITPFISMHTLGSHACTNGGGLTACTVTFTQNSTHNWLYHVLLSYNCSTNTPISGADNASNGLTFVNYYGHWGPSNGYSYAIGDGYAGINTPGSSITVGVPCTATHIDLVAQEETSSGSCCSRNWGDIVKSSTTLDPSIRTVDLSDEPAGEFETITFMVVGDNVQYTSPGTGCGTDDTNFDEVETSTLTVDAHTYTGANPACTYHETESTQVNSVILSDYLLSNT